MFYEPQMDTAISGRPNNTVNQELPRKPGESDLNYKTDLIDSALQEIEQYSNLQSFTLKDFTEAARYAHLPKEEEKAARFVEKHFGQFVINSGGDKDHLFHPDNVLGQLSKHQIDVNKFGADAVFSAGMATAFMGTRALISPAWPVAAAAVAIGGFALYEGAKWQSNVDQSAKINKEIDAEMKL